MKAEGLFAKHPQPTREEIAHALLGNLCRCTGYTKVIDAIELAAAARRGEPLPEPERSGLIGSRTARYQSAELALGDKQFIGDMVVAGISTARSASPTIPARQVLQIDPPAPRRSPVSSPS